MEQNNKQPSPYFVRRTLTRQSEAIEINNFTVVEDQVHPLRDYWLMAKRHRWLILSCASVSLIIAALYAFTRTPLYTSETTVLIERRAPQILNLKDARGEATDNDYNEEFYKTQYEILKSRALAERVIRHEGLETLPIFGGKTAGATKQGLISGVWKQFKQVLTSASPAKTQNPT